MSTSDDKPGERVTDIHIGSERLRVDLVDGRTIIVPLTWFPRLLGGTPEQRANWELCAGGHGIHWPDLDEDISTDGLLRGVAAPDGRPPRVG